MTLVTRRDALRLLAAPVGLAALGASPLGSLEPPRARAAARLKVLVVGGHPDDPESGCGGTIARYADAGHDVIVLYDATFAHASQKPDEWYPSHERMARFRGMEHGCEMAEGFVRHDRGPALPLPA